ncbi:thiol reductant ABC exporter subunit CydC [Magnetospirillum fulvum]|uniref:Cysteine ABC transporter permease/ATP-binding protein CydC n=1 Tax=Magnetospirillum fulvum MGU-K5 TaxID=1316936 RepID=S9TDT2_MAGFU|nr:thiol reductant ABC exporter subunit CydC [Magnetospirillum fulvum]EPY00411.1 cysteine ABC transporter permease/ATP-binding protein CydC [Magnetospirillum fulvum MGU-K5]
MSLLLRLLLLYRPVWGWLALAAFLALLTLLAQTGLMALSGWFIAAMALAGVAGSSLNYFTPSALIRAAAIVRTAGRYGERLVGHEATFRLIARLRVWLYRRLELLPLVVRGAHDGADLAQRLRGDLDRLETVFLRLIAPLAVALAGGGLGVLWMGRFDSTLALAEAVLLLAAGVAVPVMVARAAARRGVRQVTLLTALSGAAVEAVQGLPELLVFGADRRHRDRIEALSSDLIAEQIGLGRLIALSQAAGLLCGHLALWAAVVLTVPLLAEGRLGGPDLAMLVLLALALFEAVTPLPAAFLALGGVIESARRVFALADAAPDASEAETVPQPCPTRCDLSLRRITYRWGPEQPALFDGFEFDLPQGGRVALVGPSGSGKSTLVLLLTGLVTPEAGTIRLGDRPIESLDDETRRRCFAVAPQSCGLFSGTLRASLRLADPEADDAALWRSLTLVGLADFVAALPEGLDTWIGAAGLTLSGGQARRLAVARAWLRPAPVLILDEPGEGLDPEAEQALLDALIDQLDGRSLLLITHRSAGLARMEHVVRFGG